MGLSFRLSLSPPISSLFSHRFELNQQHEQQEVTQLPELACQRLLEAHNGNVEVCVCV